MGKALALLGRLWNQGCLGKGIIGIAVLIVLSFCGATGQAIGILPKSAPAAQPAVAPVVQTLAPAATEAPRPTRTPVPTRTLVSTEPPAPTRSDASVPKATIAADPAGVDPVNGDCPASYRVKVSDNGVAHDLDSASYRRTTPVHCYATMKDATDHGYRPAAD